jgi:hypothetical protein
MSAMKKSILALCAGAALASGACATANAKVPADRPTLDVPAPPSRVVETTPRAEPAAPEPVGELPAPAANPKPKPSPPREAARPPDPKPDPPPVETVSVPPLAPPPQLRTSGTGDGAEAQRQVRDLITRADKALKQVDYRKLSTAQRGQYDTAKMMLTQSEEKLKASNFDIAKNLAEKADRIATELKTR